MSNSTRHTFPSLFRSISLPFPALLNIRKSRRLQRVRRYARRPGYSPRPNVLYARMLPPGSPTVSPPPP